MTDTTHIYRDANTTPWGAQPGPDAEQLFYVRCPPELGGSGWRWHTPGTYIDPQVVIDAAYDSARASVPLPDLNIWPAPEHGVPVNYGIWFALHDPGVVTATAQAGPVWATATATHHSFSVDLDNGTVITCAGLGTPHPQNPNINRQRDPYRQGPCGHTYLYLSELGIRHITLTAHWTTHVVASTGLDQPLDPIDRPISFDYEVYEIVTVLVPEPPDRSDD